MSEVGRRSPRGWQDRLWNCNREHEEKYVYSKISNTERCQGFIGSLSGEETSSGEEDEGIGGTEGGRAR